MAILRTVPIPTLGMPTPAIAPQRRRKRMNQPGFYEQEPQQQQGFIEPQLEKRAQPEFRDQSVTGQYIQEHLARMQQAAQARPTLDPGARVRSANSELVQPDNFQSFYQRLGFIDQFGQEATGAASARANAKRMQAMMALQNQQVPGAKSPTLKGGSSGGQSFGGGVPSNPRENFKFAQNIAGNFGWNNPGELSAWYTLGMKESGWRNTAQNPTSTAYGIGQFLNSTWAGVGIGKTSDPALQVEAMARYIRNRYGSPSRALAFHLKNNWY